MVLIKELPISSRFYAEKRGGRQYRGWDESRYTTAAVVDAIRALQFTYILANTEKSKRSRIPTPELYPRPETSVRSLSKKLKPGSFGSVVASAFIAARKRRAQADG